MWHAKSRGSSGCGITGILTNQEAYQRWVRTTHARSQFIKSMLNLADMQQSDSHEHRDIRPTEIVRSQRNTAKAIEAVQSFLNPFTVDTEDNLVILPSGQAAADDLEHEVLRADESGVAAYDKFIEKVLIILQPVFYKCITCCYANFICSKQIMFYVISCSLSI